MGQRDHFLLRQNEADANKTVAKALSITLGIFSFIYILNLLHIFIIDQKVMTTAYLIGAVILLSPWLLNKIFNPSNPKLKYIYVFLISLFLFNLQTTLTFHATVIYAFPIAIASLYFSKKITLYALIMTMIMSTLGQFAGFYGNFVPDQNFLVLKRLVLFSVLPRALTLCSLGYLLYFLSSRTTALLDKQINNTNKIKELNQDIVLGFANLVENRDENTGGHVKRTSRYVEILSKELFKRKVYPEIIDLEFISNLTNAAPMHDIGKMSIPDYILQKPGKLTDEEFAIMKSHAEQGGKIIKQTFSHIGDDNYRQMVYEVARYHHEKWNGKGYPEGRSKTEIPLAARIMAVADVFDAISQKRCYRDPIPLPECFQIIEKGKGTDFEPILADVFLSMKDKIKQTMDEVTD
ncbi:MAG: HD domain-containing protein [Fibrobacter sp.]|nr:HD domain-containing protein [Fibrobacter sp.]